MLDSIWQWLTDTMSAFGYPGVIGLMALESSFFPFPSEVVVPPAGAAAREGELSLTLVIVAGIAGSLIGALFNYWLAVKVGRPFLLKYGKYFLVKEKTFARSEEFFQKHGEIGTFIGRLVPGVRQIISFPAGLARMNLARFLFFTTLGSGIWVTILALLGWYLGRDPEMFKGQLGKVMLWVFVGLAVILVAYVLVQRRKRPAPAEAEE
jgi:membrane protein DedA with SNARE-associated domain